jgi:phosphohistidine phosphatase SixA
MIEKLIVICHGKAGTDRRLSEEGEEQVRRLAREFKRVIAEKNVRLITSTARCATDSTKTLVRELKLPAEYVARHDCLLPEGSMDTIFEVIQAQPERVEILLLVTHKNQAENIPPVFARSVMSAHSIHLQTIPEGTARMLDCVTQQARILLGED